MTHPNLPIQSSYTVIDLRPQIFSWWINLCLRTDATPVFVFVIVIVIVRRCNLSRKTVLKRRWKFAISAASYVSVFLPHLRWNRANIKKTTVKKMPTFGFASFAEKNGYKKMPSLGFKIFQDGVFCAFALSGILNWESTYTGPAGPVRHVCPISDHMIWLVPNKFDLLNSRS